MLSNATARIRELNNANTTSPQSTGQKIRADYNESTLALMKSLENTRSRLSEELTVANDERDYWTARADDLVQALDVIDAACKTLHAGYDVIVGTVSTRNN